MFMVSINREKCSGCGECIDPCPAHILEMDEDGKANVTDPAECMGCETCVSVCPNECYTVQEL